MFICCCYLLVCYLCVFCFGFFLVIFIVSYIVDLQFVTVRTGSVGRSVCRLVGWSCDCSLVCLFAALYSREVHTGRVYTHAAAVGAIAHREGIPYLLDATQSIGQMPIDVQELGCDYLVSTGRKYLRAPRGTGLLYASR